MAKILVIDDSWLMRETIARFLKKDGYEIISTENGATGIETAIREKPDCIFLDLLMPDMHGLDVLKALREKGVTAPVLICSADVQETTRTKCLGAGAFDFITKPPKEDVVSYKIKKALTTKA